VHALTAGRTRPVHDGSDGKSSAPGCGSVSVWRLHERTHGRGWVSVSVVSTRAGDQFGEAQVRDVVEVRLPASSAYLSVLRTATAGLAARLNFTLDEIEDLRIAVDEACAMLLPQGEQDGHFTCTFTLDSDSLDVHVRIPTPHGALPERDTFAWTVLSALAGEVDAGVEPDSAVWIRLHKRRLPLGSA